MFVQKISTRVVCVNVKHPSFRPSRPFSGKCKLFECTNGKHTNKQESEISRSNVLPELNHAIRSRSFVVILVAKFPAFQPQGAWEAWVQ